MKLFARLVREDEGQDLVEYALLGAFIGLACFAGFQTVQNTIFGAYGNWDTGQQGLWVPPDPGAGGS